MDWQNKKPLQKNDSGSVLLETLICLPVILLLSLGVGQFAHIWYCRQIVQYASFSAARATLPLNADKSGNSPSEEELGALHAARRICALVSFTENEGSGQYSREWLKNIVDGGIIGGSGGLDGSLQNVSFEVERNSGVAILPGLRIGKLTVAVEKPNGNQWARAVTVRMDVPLLFPFAGQIIGKAMQIWSDGNLDIQGTDLSSTDKNLTHEYQNEFIGDFFVPHIRLCETSVIGKPFVVMTKDNLPAGYEKWGE